MSVLSIARIKNTGKRQYDNMRNTTIYVKDYVTASQPAVPAAYFIRTGIAVRPIICYNPYDNNSAPT